MDTVESDLVYGVGWEFELGSNEVLEQCFGIVRWVFGDAGKDQVIACFWFECPIWFLSLVCFLL